MFKNNLPPPPPKKSPLQMFKPNATMISIIADDATHTQKITRNSNSHTTFMVN